MVQLCSLLVWWVLALRRFMVTDDEMEAEHCIFMVTVFPLLLIGIWIGVPLIHQNGDWPYTLLLLATVYTLGGLAYVYEQRFKAKQRAKV